MTSFQPARKRLRALCSVQLTLLLLCLIPAFAEQPHFTPAVFHGEWGVSSSRVYSLDGRSEETKTTPNPLIGSWEDRSSPGTVTLEVVSDDMIVVSGREMKYQALPGIIRLMDGEGEFDYPYQLVNDRLILTISDGENVLRDIGFQRVNLSEGRIGYLPKDRSYR